MRLVKPASSARSLYEAMSREPASETLRSRRRLPT
jgi:hypothetical protein